MLNSQLVKTIKQAAILLEEMDQNDCHPNQHKSTMQFEYALEQALANSVDKEIVNKVLGMTLVQIADELIQEGVEKLKETDPDHPATRVMSEEDIKKGLEAGYDHCIVEAQSDGELCWHIEDTREREPIHKVKKGERFWCWGFKTTEKGYTHDYANMAPTDVLIDTDVELKLVYITDDVEDKALYATRCEKSPNIT